MKKYLTLPFLILLTGLFSFMPADKWVKYSSTEGRFTLSFPGQPQETEQDDKNQDGSPAKIHIATYARSNEEVYIVSWFNLGAFYPKGKSMKQMLEESRDGSTSSMKAKKVTTISTNTTGKTPYIEYTFSGDDFTGKERIYLINKVQYSVIAIFSLKAGLGKDTDKFLTSFKPL